MRDIRQQILRTRRTKIFHLRKLVNSAYWAQAEYVTIKRYDLEALLIAVKIETKEELRKLKEKTDE